MRPGGDHLPPPRHRVHREPPDHRPQRRPHPPRRGLRGRDLTPKRQSSMCLVWIIYDMVLVINERVLLSAVFSSWKESCFQPHYSLITTM